MSVSKKYIVTGAGGFVGGSIARALAQRGHRVISIARGKYPELAKFGIASEQHDLAQEPMVLKSAFEGCDGIFHVAAKVDMWGKYEDFFRANVLATRNILRACRKFNISKLVFTSSPSVVADGRDLCGINENYPYPRRYLAYYPATKAMAEAEVIAANGVEGVRTVSLRPHLIFGPGDSHLVPTILERARSRKLTRVGDGRNLIDVTYIDDCVQAHLKALEALEHTPGCGGRTFFVSQGEPVNMWEWIDEILRYSGIEPVTRRISKNAAYVLASVAEIAAKSPWANFTPTLTRFLVSEMSTHHYFDISAAKTVLGFAPKYSVKEALELTFAPSANAINH